MQITKQQHYPRDLGFFCLKVSLWALAKDGSMIIEVMSLCYLS